MKRKDINRVARDIIQKAFNKKAGAHLPKKKKSDRRAEKVRLKEYVKDGEDDS
ncbi:MAG: hypothetical protein JRJ29_01455 [Deltaproteobacteria bacterium]|nr:hypothetical protein [Deltaproteobacteria bacterium]